MNMQKKEEEKVNFVDFFRFSKRVIYRENLEETLNFKFIFYGDFKQFSAILKEKLKKSASINSKKLKQLTSAKK